MHSLLERKKKEPGVGIDLSVSLFPQAARMFSCVGCFWVLLSSALVAVCSFSFISPAWIVKDHLKNKDSVSFGLLWHCSESMDHMYRCYTFGGLGKFDEIPSSSWQVKWCKMWCDDILICLTLYYLLVKCFNLPLCNMPCFTLTQLVVLLFNILQRKYSVFQSSGLQPKYGFRLCKTGPHGHNSAFT